MGRPARPKIVSATGYLRPCNFYNMVDAWNGFKKWAEYNNLDIQELNVMKSDINTIYASKCWQEFYNQLSKNNAPPGCFVECGEEIQPGSTAHQHNRTKLNP